MGALWAVRADYETRRRRESTGPLAMALVAMVVVQAATAGPCPRHCVCADSVQWFELKCARPHEYNLTVTIQPGYYYILECDSSDDRALDPGELSPLREALGDYTYNSTTVLRCVVPARPLAELLAALHPAAGAELAVVKLEEPHGAIPDTVGLAALRQFIIIRATLKTLPPAVLAVDHLIVSRSLESLRLGADTLRPATGSRPLRTLELSRDNITELPPRVFAHLSELRRLFLWGNHLEAVSSESFAGLRSLEALDLSRNRLKTLPRALCGAMPSLRTLNLYGNPLTVVAEDTFARCAALEVLKVTHGRLKKLPFTVFMGSNAIRNLSLASQRLETLSAELFRDQHDLRHLDLSGNLLTRLAPDVFSGLGRLTHLSLDGNLLEELGRGVFSGLNALEELSVERNRLERIAADAFRGAGAAQLRRLRLAQNLLTLREGAAESASPLRALTGLQSLHLARNLIDFVYDDWRFGMLQLRLLDLSYNRFTALTYLDVNFLAMKTDIDFRHNNISKLDFAAAESEAYTTESASVSNDITVWLDDNPLRCDCEMYSVLRANTAVSRPRLQWGQAECVAPPVLRGVPLASLSADRFTCELDSCNATNCTCRARPAERILEVQCMGAVRLPRLEPAVVGARWHLERTEMILNGSNIDHFGPQDPAPDVTVLDLRDNRLSRLDAASVRRLLAPRRALWLAGNPIECDCDNEPLLRSLREHHLQVRDYERLRCADGKLIQDLLPGELCVGLTVPIAAALALLAALVAVLVLLYRRFESEAKVWLYARGLCLRCLNEEELDRDKRYDAFVSFSHLDEPFVVGELVPTLETGPHPLRLCVHVRDWPAGEWIPAQIARSVEQSCRTIVVLSPNFLESVWGRVEFRAAHAAALREGRARVVVVLYGEALDARQLDPELRAYLATNTYIKWGDPYFWHKLRLELPHRRTPNRLVECAPPLTELVAARKAGFQDGLELRPASTAPVHAL